jgi:hypothetical protein
LGGACLQGVPDAGLEDAASEVSSDARIPFDTSVQPEAGDGSDQTDTNAADAAADDTPKDAAEDDAAIQDAPLDQSAVECKEWYGSERIVNGDLCFAAACLTGFSPDAATPCGTKTCVGSEWCIHRGVGLPTTGWDAEALDSLFSCHPPADFTCSGGMCCWKDCISSTMQFRPSERTIWCQGI